MIGLDNIIKELRPGAVFELTNYSFTKWFDPTGKPPPTQEEIENFVKNLQQ